MSKEKKPAPIKKEPETIKHQVGKKVFIVTPVYREDSNKTIHGAILNLMKNDK